MYLSQQTSNIKLNIHLLSQKIRTVNRIGLLMKKEKDEPTIFVWA